MNTLFAVVGGFASGVLLRSLFVSGWPIIIFTFMLAGIFAAAAKTRPRLAYTLCALFFISFALGAARMHLADTPLPPHFATTLGTFVSYEGVVVGDPDVRDTNQRVPVFVSANGESAKMLAVADRYPGVAVGERVSVSGTLALPQPFSSADEGGRVFAYDKYLQKDGVRFLINNASFKVLEPAPWYSVPSALAQVKHAFLGGLSAALPEPYASLAGGIVIGGKTGLGSELQNAFIMTGLVQIIVLSGYNVMVVAEWVMYLIGVLRFRRGSAALAGAIAVVLFVAVAGATSTAIRAALMALIALYARASGRTYAAGRALLAIIVLVLAWNPFILAFDPGFGLSVAATAGLIWLSPLIELKLARIKNAFWRSALATTLSAQAAVLPLLLYQTGVFSIVSVPANLLVTAVMPAAMGLAALAGLAGAIFGAAGWPLALPGYALTAYIIAIARWGSALPFAALHLPAFPFIFVLLAYAALIYIAFAKRDSMTLQFTLSKKAST